jgi:RNA polymerase sigma-70 factor (ECF subfamily)
MAPVREGPSPSSPRREALHRTLLEDGDRLYALALRVTRDPDLAADAVQEAFATALEKEAGFRGEARLSTWLYRIVYNKAVDLLRRRGREEPWPEDEGTTLAAEDDRRSHEPSWARPPDEILLGREARKALDESLDALTPLQRAVFELREVEARPTDEVAEILDLTPGAVRVNLHRARLRLRERLSPHFRGERT